MLLELEVSAVQMVMEMDMKEHLLDVDLIVMILIHQ
jgi:hypothetical protein